MISSAKLHRRNTLLGGTTLAVASAVSSGAPLTAAQAQTTSQLNPQPLPPSPDWARAMPTGPDATVKITEAYARMVARNSPRRSFC
jgi:hypothetical protein